MTHVQLYLPLDQDMYDEMLKVPNRVCDTRHVDHITASTPQDMDTHNLQACVCVRIHAVNKQPAALAPVLTGSQLDRTAPRL